MEVHGDEVIMVRYSRSTNGRPKNTLYTIRRGETIYFGISRCNPKFDQFRKDAGKHIAAERAVLAVEEHEATPVSDFEPHERGLRGVCTRAAIVDLLQYFDHIDDILIERLNEEQA